MTGPRGARLELLDFRDPGKLGGVVRLVTASSTRTLVAFRPVGAAPVRFEQGTEFEGVVERWTAFTMSYGPAAPELRAERRGGVVTFAGAPRPELAGAVPSYAAHLVLRRLLVAGADRLAYRELLEGREPRVVDAVLARRGPEELDAPAGRVTAERVELLREGELANVFWCVRSAVLAVDWGGARSYRVEALGALLEGLDPEVAGWIEEFAVGHGAVSPR